MPKTRLDLLVVEKGMAETRSQAQRLIMAGQIRVKGQVEYKPSTRVDPSVDLQVDLGPRFVSRGGEKLEAAIQAFAIDPTGLICADVGASTGGFTDCLLQHGAAQVYAIDVGYGILHWKLRRHPKVTSMERTNARFLETLPEPVSLVTVDASFISLKLILPVIHHWLKGEKGKAIVLIKPQFEAGKHAVDRGEGVIQDPAVHRQVLEDVLNFAQVTGYEVSGLIRSPLKGPKGNTEFLAYLEYPKEKEAAVDQMVAAVTKEG